MKFFDSVVQLLQNFFLTKRLFSTHLQFNLTTSAKPLLLPDTSPYSKEGVSQLLISPINNFGEKKLSMSYKLAQESTSTSNISEFLLHKKLPAVMYVAKKAPLLAFSHKSYDSCLKILYYGDAVTVVSFQGNYAQIQKGKDIGWVEKDVLQNRKENVWPTFSIGSWYDSNHEMTKRTRQLIQDEFFAGGASLPLQSAEYITVELLKDNRRINWSQGFNRLPSRWHQMLRGVLGVHITIHPTTESVMEWTNEDGVGRLAYVREVQPDNTLRIEGIGILEDGIFESVILPEALWREWRPVFIEIV